MPKLKRQGIDFFTIHTDYLHSRAVRRVMKREGEAAIAVLMETYAAIYAGDGYYVEAGPRLFDDLADLFFRLEPEDVKRILETAIENGLFDAGLYSQYGILTSSGIQSEFIYATRKRINKSIDPRFNLLTDDDEALCCRDMPEPKTPDGQRSGLPRRKEDGENEGTEPTETCPEKVPGNTQKVPGTTQKAEDNAKKRDLTPQSTHTTRHNTTRRKPSPQRFPRRRGNRRRRLEACGGGRRGWGKDERKTGRQTEGPRMDAAGHRRPATARRRTAAQPGRAENQLPTAPDTAQGAVCHHPEEQLRRHRASRVEGVRRAARKPRQNPATVALLAESLREMTPGKGADAFCGTKHPKIRGKVCRKHYLCSVVKLNTKHN